MLGPVGDLAGKVVEFGGDAIQRGTEIVTDVLDIGEAEGDDGGSSNWDAWGHEAIRSMLDASVDPGNIQEIAAEWRVLAADGDEFAQFARDLSGIITGGWRGAAADAANATTVPIGDWATRLSERVQQTSDLMSQSGDAAEHARREVPAPVSHDWGQSVRSFGEGFAGGGPIGGAVNAGVDAVAQDNAQAEAKAEAVRIMNTVYSAPINENRGAVPTYPQLDNLALQPPDRPPGWQPPPGEPGAPPGGPGGASGTPQGTHPQATATPYQAPPGPPPPGGGVPSPEGTSGQSTAGQPGGPRPPSGPQHPGDQGGRGAPVVPPAAMGGGVAGGGGQTRSGRGFGGSAGGGRGGSAGSGSGRPASAGGGGGGGGRSGFGPSGPGQAGAGQPGAARGGVPGGSAGARGGGMGPGMMGAAGAGRGSGGEDSEHQRKILIEADRDAIVGELDAVAPPVIGEDPDVYQRPRDGG